MKRIMVGAQISSAHNVTLPALHSKLSQDMPHPAGIKAVMLDEFSILQCTTHEIRPRLSY